eukprot:5736599-Prymnesium_polylepis.1
MEVSVHAAKADSARARADERRREDGLTAVVRRRARRGAVPPQRREAAVVAIASGQQAAAEVRRIHGAARQVGARRGEEGGLACAVPEWCAGVRCEREER